ncbi:MAG: ParB/RepB/Spo0J family partition protein [Terriglobales bacterium]
MSQEKRKALGRGLEALLPLRGSAVAPPPPPTAAVAPAGAMAEAALGGEAVREIPVEEIDRNPYQTRTRMDEAALNELAASIQSAGVVQPIVVRKIDGGRYQLIAGQRRWAAAQRAGKATVPALVRQVSAEQALEMAIIENLQREDLNPVEQARAYERLSKEFGLTQEQMALKTGKDRPSIGNYLRLLKLPFEVQVEIENGPLTLGHAKVLMALESPELIAKVAKVVVEDALSVRQTEDVVRDILYPVEKKEQVRYVDPNVREAEKELQRALGAKVTIKDRKGKGKIIIEYASLEDFDRVVDALKK